MSRSFAELSHNFPRPVMLLATGASIITIFIFRIIISRIFRPHPQLVKAIIVGDPAEGKRIIKHFHRRGGVRFRIVRSMKSEEIDELASEVVFKHVAEVFVTDEVAKDISMHAAAMKPLYVKKEEVPAEELEKERVVLKEQAVNDSENMCR